jgi:hypothetical protein
MEALFYRLIIWVSIFLPLLFPSNGLATTYPIDLTSLTGDYSVTRDSSWSGNNYLGPPPQIYSFGGAIIDVSSFTFAIKGVVLNFPLYKNNDDNSITPGPILGSIGFDDNKANTLRLYFGAGIGIALDSYQYSGTGYSLDYTLNGNLFSLNYTVTKDFTPGGLEYWLAGFPSGEIRIYFDFLFDNMSGLPQAAGMLNITDASLSFEASSIPLPPPGVPIPGTVWLLGSGLLRLACYRRKLKKG